MSLPPANAIDIHQVSKAFGAHTAVDDLSLEVPAGAIYGFIGPNGSGKTTTIRLVMNLLAPDRGDIRVLGQPSQSAVRDRVGYLPEERGLYKRMTVRQVLRYYGQLKGQPLSALDPAIAVWLDRLNLAPWIDKPVQALSKGMAQKVQFISTIIAKPDLVILDEPFSGLDPLNADALRDAILSLRQAGVTIVLSTHDMTVAERLCDRIFMIFKGKKVLDGSMADIHQRFGQDVVRLRTTGGASVLAGLPGVASVVDAGNVQDVRLTGDAQAFLQALVARTTVQHFEVTKPSLHDIFKTIAQPTEADLAPSPAGPR